MKSKRIKIFCLLIMKILNRFFFKCLIFAKSWITFRMSCLFSHSFNASITIVSENSSDVVFSVRNDWKINWVHWSRKVRSAIFRFLIIILQIIFLREADFFVNCHAMLENTLPAWRRFCWSRVKKKLAPRRSFSWYRRATVRAMVDFLCRLIHLTSIWTYRYVHRLMSGFGWVWLLACLGDMWHRVDDDKHWTLLDERLAADSLDVDLYLIRLYRFIKIG